MRSLLFSLASIQLLGLARCQFPPPLEDVVTIQSKFGNGISISYKEVCCKMLDPMKQADQLPAWYLRDNTRSEVVRRLWSVPLSLTTSSSNIINN